MTEILKSLWIHANQDVVFCYFVENEKVIAWSGLEATMDAKPGGAYQLDLGLGGLIQGQFLEIRAPDFISWEIYPKVEHAPPTTVTVSLRAEVGGCLVELRQTALPEAVLSGASRAWDYHLARLSVAAAGGSPGEDLICKRTLESLIDA
ncbi:MAG: SRPBCC domain-containing protein [Pseudomonadota bacterium]